MKFYTLFLNVFPLLIIALLLTFVGFVILSALYKSRNKCLTLGSAMIIGPLGFLFLLSIGSYFFKGQLAILGMFLLYTFTAFVFYLRKRRNIYQNFFRFSLNGENLLILGAVSVYLGLIFLFAHRSFVGSDSDIYYSIATSFARGNYPVVQSWQPNFLTVYHQETYLLEGALWALSGKDIELIHYFFSVYIIWAIFLFLTGLAREKIRSVFCILPAVFGIILVGGPVMLSKISSLFSFLSSLKTQPDFAVFQSSNGAGATNLSGLIYNNFYTFGLAAFLLFLLLFINQSVKQFNFGRYLILLTLIVLGVSIDETFFPLELLLFCGLLFWQSRDFSIAKKYIYLPVMAGIFVLLFVTIQNPIRDSVLTPSPELPRFKLLIENNWQPNERVSWNGFNLGPTVSGMRDIRMKYAAQMTLEDNNLAWIRLDIRLVYILLFVALLVVSSRWGFLLVISSVFSYIFSIFINNTFWPANAFRITNQAFQLAFIAVAFVIVGLLAQKKFFKKFVAAVIILLLLPQLLSSHSKFFTFPLRKWEANSTDARNNFTKVKKDLDLENIAKIIPPGKVTVFLDRYPTTAPFSYLNYTALTKMGVFVPIGPSKVKILNPAPGIEWLDTINSLSPYAFKELNVEYAYIQNAALVRLSPEKLAAIKNHQYFQEVKKFGDDGILYKVLRAYGTTPDEPNSLKQMSLTIGTGKRVYLDKLHFNEVRKALILELAKKDHLIGFPPAHGGDFYMYIETLLPFETETPEGLKNLDYVITDKEKDPNKTLPGRFEKLMINNYVSLWVNQEI